MKRIRSRPWVVEECGRASRAAWLAVVVLATVFLAGCPPAVVRIKVPPEDIVKANQAAREGDVAFARKDSYAALIKYLEASRLNPNSEFIQNKLGIAYSQLKYYLEATAALQRAMGLNSKYPYPYNNLGTVYFASGNKKKAEKYFKKAISLDSKVASFHINLGSLYFEMGRIDRAMGEYRAGLALDPEVLTRGEAYNLSAPGNRTSDPKKAYGLARIYASMSDVDRAVESLQRALDTGFTDIDAIRTEPDFDPIRNSEKFLAFMKTATMLLKP